MCRKKSRNGTQTIESACSTTAPPSPLTGHKTQCNRIPKLFQWLLPLSHRHLSALIHDKLSHLIHDKSSEGPIETRRWRGGREVEEGVGDKRMEGQARRECCSAPEWSGSYCLVFRKVAFITSKGMLCDRKWDHIALMSSLPKPTVFKAIIIPCGGTL